LGIIEDILKIIKDISGFTKDVLKIAKILKTGFANLYSNGE